MGKSCRLLTLSLSVLVVASFVSSCSPSQSTPSGSVRRYFYCHEGKNADCVLKLFTSEYVEKWGSVSRMKDILEWEFQNRRENLVSIDAESATNDIAEVKVTYVETRFSSVETKKRVFALKRLNGEWLIVNRD